MKKIEAIICPEKLEPLRKALEQHGYPGITVTEVSGHGSQKGTLSEWHGRSYRIDFLPKTKVEIVVSDEEFQELIDIISDTVNSGTFGDGKIFIYDIFDVVRIRTGQRGEEAIA